MAIPGGRSGAGRTPPAPAAEDEEGNRAPDPDCRPADPPGREGERRWLKAFEATIGKCFVSNDHATAAAIEYGGTANGGIEEEALVWASPLAATSACSMSKAAGTVTSILTGWRSVFWEDETLDRESKPLIETKFRDQEADVSSPPAFVALSRNLAMDTRAHA